jgi:glycosidase
VATYWIENYEIDGWRLDQAYQLYQDGHNYWKEIRETIETTCAQRKTAGNQWGTLGYMVGEIWQWHPQIIQTGYGSDSTKGLPSCFDFPTRYRMVQVLATQENTSDSWATAQPASALKTALDELSQYPSFAKPNLMITNHDLVRFGDLIQRASGLGYGTENPDYWARHRAAFSFMAQYTGPVTLYYGDEIGEEVEGFIKNQDGGYYDDHVSRSQGRISGFNANETALKEYVSALWKFRSENPALWNGTRKNIAANTNIFADYKVSGSNKILYILNVSTSQQNVTVPVSNIDNASTLTKVKIVSSDTTETLSPTNSNFYITVPALSGVFYQVN